MWLSRRLSNVLLLWLAGWLLSGCGFQLRGDMVLHGVGSIYVHASNQVDGITPRLQRQFVAAGIELVESQEHADVSLRITRDRFDRRVLSVSQANRVLEYELQYQVEYVLQQGGISQLPVMVTMTRDFVNDEENVLGTSAQASVVREELERDIVQALLRKINAQLRYLAVGETSSK